MQKQSNTQTKLVVQLPNLNQAEIQHVYSRLVRFRDLYQKSHRMGGNLIVPEPEAVVSNGILVHLEHYGVSEICLDDVTDNLTLTKIDILTRTLLVQIAQLRSMNYLHGSIAPEDLLIFRRGKYWAFSLKGLEKGRFLNEPATSENQYTTLWGSPEYYRWSENPRYNSSPEDDMFAVGCLYYKLLMGGQELTGLNGVPPGKGIARGIPVCVSGSEERRMELIRWIISPDPKERPTPEEVLSALVALDQMAPICTFIDIAPIPSKRHAPGQVLGITVDGRTALVRRLYRLWKPYMSGAQGMAASFLVRQEAFFTREMTRLAVVCQRSLVWENEQSGILPCMFYSEAGCISVSTLLPEGPLFMPGQLPEMLDSPYLLDARFIDILLAVQTLHEDGWILGLVSEDRFCIQWTPSGGKTWLVDVSAAIHLKSIPAPGDIRPDAETGKLLSPELAQYITSASERERKAAEGWIGPASDIFSLGLLYHLVLTGKFPVLRSNTFYSFADAVCFSDSSQQAFELDSQLDEQHSNLIYDMLKANPMERPANCESITWRILSFYTA